mmetsp:Transcript_24013/g.26655  ORF Transcript_24013/g.26655 Transcript_24013/m.26655 type:complete len:303 (-) Transcript_24013:92-1000(-)
MDDPDNVSVEDTKAPDDVDTEEVKDEEVEQEQKDPVEDKEDEPVTQEAEEPTEAPIEPKTAISETEDKEDVEKEADNENDDNESPTSLAVTNTAREDETEEVQSEKIELNEIQAEKEEGEQRAPAVMMDTFVRHGIVKDLIPSVPLNQLEVTFGDVSVTPGVKLTVDQTTQQPSVSFSGAVADKTYTLMKIDPDAPTRNGFLGPVKHWLVIDIPGGDVTKGKHIAPYLEDSPPSGTGPHRYVFLLFEQPDSISDELERTQSSSHVGRLRWKLRSFLHTYKYQLPVAGNFYLAEHQNQTCVLL